MAQLPTIVSTANRRILPTADLKVDGVTPAAFGAGIGAGLQQIGEAGQQTGAAMQALVLAKQQEEDRLAEFDRQTQFVSFGSDQSTKLTEASRDLSGPAQDFTKSRMEGFDADAAQFLEKVPERFRPAWQARMAQLRAGVAGEALRTEFTQRDSYYKTTIGDTLGKLLNGAMSSPDKLDDWRAQGEEIINTSGLSAQDKLEYATRWKGQIGVAAAQGDLQRDPEGAMARLGGIDFIVETKDGYAGSGASYTKGGQASLKGDIINFFVGKGVPQSVARGIAAGIESESSGNHRAVNDSSGAYGLGQWLGPRKEALFARYGSNPTREQQLEFLYSELKGGDRGGPAVLAAKDEGQAVDRYIRGFMRPGKDTETGVKRGMRALGYKVQEAKREPDYGSQTAGGMIAPGNIDLANRKAVNNADGSISTEQSFSIGTDKGEVLIPRVVNGKVISEAQAIAHFRRTGENLGTFRTPEDADRYAEQLHQRQEARYSKSGNGPDVSTRLVGNGQVDPRYADIPIDARVQLIGAAEREIAGREREVKIAEAEVHDKWVNQFMLDLSDGKAGPEDIEAARKSGRLTDFDEINRAQSIVEARQKANIDIDTFNALSATPGFAWNPYDDRQRKAVDAAVTAQGGTPQAAFNVWQKTGILGKAGGVALRGAMISTDPNTVSAGASIASNMLARNPNAFAGVEGGEEIERNALLYGHYVNDLGYSPGDAAKRVAEQNTPEMRRKIQMGQPEVAAFRKTVQRTDVQGMLGKALDTTWFDGRPTFLGPEQRQAAGQDYADLAADHFQRYGDANAAQSYASAQMRRLYGVVNGRLMKYPPTRAYPVIGGSQSYIFEQAAADIKKVTGRTVDPSKVYLMPIPTATAEAFRAGKAPPYEVHYVDKVNGQNVYRVLNGQAFYADPRVAARAAGQANKVRLEKERQDYLAREQFERDATVARFGYLPGVNAPGK